MPDTHEAKSGIQRDFRGCSEHISALSTPVHLPTNPLHKRRAHSSALIVRAHGYDGYPWDLSQILAGHTTPRHRAGIQHVLSRPLRTRSCSIFESLDRESQPITSNVGGTQFSSMVSRRAVFVEHIPVSRPRSTVILPQSPTGRCTLSVEAWSMFPP